MRKIFLKQHVATTAQRVQFRTRTVYLCERTERFTTGDNYSNASFDTWSYWKTFYRILQNTALTATSLWKAVIIETHLY